MKNSQKSIYELASELAGIVVKYLINENENVGDILELVSTSIIIF